MLQNENNCHSEPNLQSLTREESQRSYSQNDTALVGADSISAHQRGITLVALVVTIVVLLILAGITINFAISEGGIIAKANQAKEKQEIGQLKDQINLNVVDWYADKILNDNVTIDNLWDKLVQDKIIADAKTDVEGPDANGVYLITTNKGYVIEVIIDNKGNVTVGEGGKKDELPPRIVEFKSTGSTTSSITVKAEVTRIEDGGKLSYYYKKSSETEYKALKENTTDKTADYTGLTQNIAYDLKLVVKNKNGSVDKTISVLTGELESGTISQKGTTTWSAGTASVELQTTDTTNTMQYQKNGIAGTWTNYGAAITGLVHGDIIYARMFDGINGSEAFSINIMDGLVPTVTETSSNATTNSVSLAVTAVDNESGMVASPTYTFYRKVSTEADTSYIKDQEGTSNSYTKTGLLQNTTYTIKVETKDKANNTGSMVKNITTGNVGGATGGLTGGNVVASIPTWSAGTASITLSTSTGLSLQWQKNNISSTGWTTGTSVTGLNHGDTLYARLTDGTNYGDSASVSILDRAIPQTATINLSKTTTDTATAITATVTQIDNESGVNITSGKWVYNNTSGQIGTAESSYTGGNFSSNPQTITLNATTAGTYYLHVLTVDKAGNKKETVSTPVTVEKKAVADGSYSDEKGVNTPKLGSGMTPIKWNGSSFVKTTPDDSSWYNYSSKQWANAQTADGSQWVWIPRYAFQIANNYHNGGNGVYGTINVEFMKGTTNTSSSGRSSFNNSTGQGNWNIHPAFEYGGQVSGIWVAKYEASRNNASTGSEGSGSTMKIQPTVMSWRTITVNDIYNTCLNYNSRLNSHQMKNVEWGAVAYLSKSKYGKDSIEVGVNECNQYITGMGPGGSSEPYSGSLYAYNASYAYNTTQGQKASTTGNVYGVYDMSGGSYEYTAAYVNNGHGNLQTYGASLVNTGVAKNKDVYTMGSGDGQVNNYNANAGKYGDGVYETSNHYSSGSGSWFGDYSSFPYSSSPFFRRGEYCGSTSNAGVFAFNHSKGSLGSASIYIGFRPVLVAL